MSTNPTNGHSVTGIDGCKGGWVAVRRSRGEWMWDTAPTDGIGALIDDGSTTGIDIPIGLCDTGQRECDVLARRALAGAASRVFMTPPRAVLELGWHAPNDEVQELSRRLSGKGVSRQALALGPRILAVDSVITERSTTTVIEVHPELSFAEMADGHPLPSKKSNEGARLRIEVLRVQYSDIDDVLEQSPHRVALDDRLDALAVLWTAERWRDGRARTLPEGATAAPFIAR